MITRDTVDERRRFLGAAVNGTFLAPSEGNESDRRFLCARMLSHSRSGNSWIEGLATEAVIDAYDTYVMESPERDGSVELGGYVMFQFAVALQWARAFVSLAKDSGERNSPAARAEECIDEMAERFRRRVSHAPELERYGRIERWIASVDRTMMTELWEVSEGFLSTLYELPSDLSRAESLRRYSVSLAAMKGLSGKDLEWAAGRSFALLCIEPMDVV